MSKNNTVQKEEKNSEVTKPKIDLSRFKAPTSKGISVKAADAGVMSIIYSPKNGKRITFAKDVMEKLNNPNQLLVLMNEEGILISENLSDHDNYFAVRKQGAKGVLYSSSLVKEIIDQFELDFSDKVSKTFHDVIYEESEQGKMALIYVK